MAKTLSRQTSRLSFAATLLAGLALCCNASRAEEPPAPDVKTLVEQLGNDRFAVRESATNRLIQTGVAAKPLLMTALKSSDAEVRFRAKRILSIVVETDFQRRLNAFQADADGKLGATMPGWKAFQQVVGNDRDARTLFIEMQQAEAALLELYEEDPKKAGLLLKDRSQLPLGLPQGRGRRAERLPIANQGTICAQLFVGGDLAVPISDEVATRLIGMTKLQTFSSVVNSPVGRKILGRWVGREIGMDLIPKSFELARQHKLAEGVNLAETVLNNGQANSEVRWLALALIGSMGNKERIPAVEPLLKDTEVLRTFNDGDVQVRDVALLTMIWLAEQEPQRFGFRPTLGARQSLVNLSSVAFSSDEARAAAFRKWETWQEEQKRSPTKSSDEAPADGKGS